VLSKKGKKDPKDVKVESIPEKKEEIREEKDKKEIEVTALPEKGKEESTETDILKQRLKESENQAKELEDKLLRVAADFDNFKKRIAREFENLAKFANENLITKLTETLDNFHRALDPAKNSTDFDNFHKGVELIYESLMDVLEKEGLKPIKTIGETFDPNFHEAISQRESDEFPEGTIVEEISKGYILNHRVIKAPKVIISTGAKKEEEQKEEEKVETEEKNSVEENEEGS
jgi:molecular chaperone GrpE